MKSLFNQNENLEFEILNESEMDQLRGGFFPLRDRDILDPDEE